MSIIDPLPEINSQKQFIDTLADMVTPPKFAKPTRELRGRPYQLKTYLIESNNDGKLTQSFMLDSMIGEIRNTGLDTLKVLRLMSVEDERKPTQKPYHVEFYLDMSNPRFLLLHTNFHSRKVGRAVRNLVGSTKFEFDHAWLSTTTLTGLSERPGNTRSGYKIGYRDIFVERDEEELMAENNMVVEASGGLAQVLFQWTKQDETLEKTLGYEYVRIARGYKSHGIEDDVWFDGRMSVKRGRSVEDHMVLVNSIKDEYCQKITEAEKLRMDGRMEGDMAVIDGFPFEFEFRRKVESWDGFLAHIFDGKEPFKLWGLKTKIRNGYYRILAVDMHTGHPLDIEVSEHILRVYLPKQSCGNVLLRLFVNLQRYFDATIKCAQLSA